LQRKRRRIKSLSEKLGIIILFIAENIMTTPEKSTIALNRKARFEYYIEDEFEAGLVLEGWEVKSIRAGKVNISDAHIIVKRGEAFLLGAQINPLMTASTHNINDPTRTRKLLLKRRQINQLIGHIERDGYTVIPLSMNWKKNNVKIHIALAKGKKLHDKRDSEKNRDWAREKGRVMKQGRHGE
jgi:SsrA-binding protein